MKESDFQRDVKAEIRERLPGCIIFKTDPRHMTGFPDLCILYKKRWGCLEVKVSGAAHKQPHQNDWVKLLNDMSFAAVIYPENRGEVLNEMERSLKGLW